MGGIPAAPAGPDASRSRLGHSVTLPGSAQELLPWQSWIEKPVPEGTKSLADLFGLPWQNSGGKEGSLAVSDTPGPWGGTYFKFQVKIDHFNEAQYPMGWPSFEIRPNPPLDGLGFDAVQYWIRCETALDRPLDIRLILWSGGKGRLNEQLPPFRAGQWVQVTHRIRDFPQTVMRQLRVEIRSTFDLG